MFKKIMGMVLCGVTLCLLALVGLPAAKAGGAEFRPRVNGATHRCLDGNLKGEVYALGCNGGLFQNWIIASSASAREINSQATGRCLDTNSEGKVYALSCNKGDNQQWDVSGGHYKNIATGKCLDSNADGKVYALDCNGGDNQRWQ